MGKNDRFSPGRFEKDHVKVVISQGQIV